MEKTSQPVSQTASQSVIECTSVSLPLCVLRLRLILLLHLVTTHSLFFLLFCLFFFFLFPQTPHFCCYGDRGPSVPLLPAVLAAPNGLLGVPRRTGASQRHPHGRYDLLASLAAYCRGVPPSQLGRREVRGVGSRPNTLGVELNGVFLRRLRIVAWAVEVRGGLAWRVLTGVQVKGRGGRSQE